MRMEKKQKSLVEMPKSKKVVRGGRPTFVGLEEKLVDWILKSRMNGVIITHTAIRVRALNLMKTPEFVLKKPVNFITFSSWYSRFMSRHNLCIRANTKIAQKLPSQLENTVEAFQLHVIQLRKKILF